jgi:hypothetical protein
MLQFSGRFCNPSVTFFIYASIYNSAHSLMSRKLFQPHHRLLLCSIFPCMLYMTHGSMSFHYLSGDNFVILLNFREPFPALIKVIMM